MVHKLSKSIMLVLVLVLVSAGAVYAEEGTSPEKIRFLGEITRVDAMAGSFSLLSHTGEDLVFSTNEGTAYRSRVGSIHSLDDISVGMKALVSAYRDQEGNFVALMVAAGDGADFEDIQRYKGTIFSVNTERQSFSLEMEEGRFQQFVVTDRTRYKSRDGSISDLADLESGMVAYVVAIERENQIPLSLVVAVGKPVENRERFRVIGQITNVMPDQAAFELKVKNGDLITFNVVDRTNFRSRGALIKSIHDLEEGMHALVIGVEGPEGSSLALVVAAGK